MKKEIVKNKYYEAYVDVENNRMYWVMKGQWNKMTDIPDYVYHNKEVLRYLKPGFTALTDIRTLEMPSPAVIEVITEMVQMMENAGMGRQAQILNKNDLVAIRTSRNVMKEADMDLKMMQFGSYEDAIEWLDR